MPRKPIDQRSKLRGQDCYWAAIRQLSAECGAFTLSDVVNRSNAPKNSVEEYMRRLKAAGYIEKAGKSGAANLFRVLRDSRFTPRVRRDGSEVGGNKQDHMWRAAKMIKSFTPQDLAVSASTDQVTVSEVQARDYCQRLARAGYFRRVEPNKYAMLPSKNTGPLAPCVQRVKQVFDPNLNRVVWRSGDDDE